MDLETQTPSIPSIDQPFKKQKTNWLTIILIIFAVLGLGFGVYEYYQNSVNKSEVKSLESRLSANKDKVEFTAPSVESAEKLLENYTGVGPSEAISLNAYYDTFSLNFDDTQKAFLTYHSIKDDQKNTVTCKNEQYKKGACTQKSISYNIINQKYKSLFGSSKNMKKENYEFIDFFYLVYNSDTDEYDEYVLQGGGTTPVVALHKVIMTKGTASGFVATVPLIEIDTNITLADSFPAGATLSGDLGITDETINKAVESMAIYEFTFVKDGENYVLQDVTKLGK